MKSILKYTVLFVVGGLFYGLVEILFRGFTHWSMLIAGGVCFILLYLISTKSKDVIWKKWVMGGIVITTVEFVTGGIVNLVLGWNVWDYSEHSFNLMGQICLLFTAMWTALSIPVMWICTFLESRVFRHLSRKAWH